MSSNAITLHRLRALEPSAPALFVRVVTTVLGVGLNLPGRRIRFEVEGWERLPDGPAIYVTNHTHWLDWIGMRWVCIRRGRTLCNWVKPRTYEEGWSTFLDYTGNIPVVSRGYLIAADIRQLTGRAPTEAEYRTIRDLLDHGTPLPDHGVFAEVQTRPRETLGRSFEPSRETYREHLESLFHQMMQVTVEKTRTLLRDGMALSIYPQGVTSMRLTRGHPGAIQAALALGLPLVPFGVSGFPQCWDGKKLLPARGGTVRLRVGEPWTVALPSHAPFLPASEREHAVALQSMTDDMMNRINNLLDPEHMRSESEPDALDVNGVERFI